MMALAESENSETSPESRPIVIVALMLATTLGDFIEYNLFAASFKRQFRNARLIAYYRRDRPFKDAILEMNPEIDEAWPQEGKDTVKSETFNVAPDSASDKRVDILLTPSMMILARLPSLPSLVRFQVPGAAEESFRTLYADAGLDPSRWYCVLHYREPSYEGRGANPDRDIDPGDPIAMTRFVIEELGGQVVRVGHPEMAEFPDLPGFLDLSRVPNAIQIQAAAVRSSRFFLELSPSGPMALAPCFGVPVARCNALILAGPTTPDSIVLNQHLIDPDGNRVPIEICEERNLLNGSVMPSILRDRGFGFQRNTLSEMKAVAAEMARSTADHQGLPAMEIPREIPTGDRTRWPIQGVRPHRVFGYDFAPPEGGI
jgi:putative glycosyltransferase (TIGR04372 family)